MRCTKPSLRKLSFIFAASIALGCSVPSVALPGQAGSEPDNETVTKAVSDYQATVDAEWTDSNTSTSATTLTSTEQEAHDSRDELANEGTAVTSAKSEVSIIETTPQQDGTIIVTADISTEFTYNGESEPGSWSDRHLITLSQGSSGYIVTADEIDDSAAEEAAIAGEVPDGYNPTPSSDDPNAAALPDAEDSEDQPAASPARHKQPRTNVGNMVKYALKWTGRPNNGDKGDDFNPDYPHAGNNCANFVSEVLHAGGWGIRPGFLPPKLNLPPDSPDIWTPRYLWHIPGSQVASHTWSVASFQYNYVIKHSSYTPLIDIQAARAGDLFYTDWYPERKKGGPDGKIDHVMVVTGTSWAGEPRVSQKTPNRHNIPVSQTKKRADKQGLDVTWYALKR